MSRLGPRGRALVCTTALLLVAPRGGLAQATLPDGFSDSLVSSGLSQPVGIAFLPDGRLLFVEQKNARVRVIRGTSDPSPLVVGSIPSLDLAGTERGLLGIAVDPQWPSRPYIYVHYTAQESPTHVHVSRFTISGDLMGTAGGAMSLNPGTEYKLVSNAPDDADIHNGGSVRFGPDHMLYVSIGEDGQACFAQDTSSMHGVILRLDVSRLPDGPGIAPRALVTPPDNPWAASPDSSRRIIWAFGLRNPFRIYPDPADGAVYIGDVGENQWEELDRAESGGLDFGWPYYEGPASHTSSCSGIVKPMLRDPIYAYDRSVVGGTGANSVIMPAGPYRPPAGAMSAFPSAYWGDVFFGDYYAGHMWRLHFDGTNWALAAPVPGQPSATTWAEGIEAVTDYAIAPDGSWWYCRASSDPTLTVQNAGEIHRIVTQNPVSVPQVQRVAVSPVYPVPSPGTVHLGFSLGQEGIVELAIHDLRGAQVRRILPRARMSAAMVPSAWDGRDDHGHLVESGLYFARLVVDGSVWTRRVVIAR